MKTHWKKLTNPDYIGAYEFQPGEEKILTIKSVKRENITGADGKKEDCTIIRWVENVKPMICNSTNAKTIEKICKTPYIEDWAGHRIQLHVERVKAFGDIVDAVRVGKTAPKDVQSAKIEKCHDCGKDIVACSGMTSEQVAAYTKSKYGVEVCAECGAKRKEQVASEPIQKDESEDKLNDTAQPE